MKLTFIIAAIGISGALSDGSLFGDLSCINGIPIGTMQIMDDTYSGGNCNTTECDAAVSIVNQGCSTLGISSISCQQQDVGGEDFYSKFECDATSWSGGLYKTDDCSDYLFSNTYGSGTIDACTGFEYQENSANTMNPGASVLAVPILLALSQVLNSWAN